MILYRNIFIISFLVPTYSVKRNSSRCKGSDDKTEYRGKVRSLATCAALCNGVSKYFSMAKHYEEHNRKCSAKSGLHRCECYCEVGDTCEAEQDEEFDTFAFRADEKGGSHIYQHSMHFHFATS